MNTEKLIRLIEAEADEYFDGHFTIMKFTTGWKVVLDTPDVTPEYRKWLSYVDASKDLKTALMDRITADDE
jgi:hypothetical protein